MTGHEVRRFERPSAFRDACTPFLLRREATNCLPLGLIAAIDAASPTDRWLARVDGGLWLREVDGTPVAMAGAGGPTPNGIRIGAVYTPPDRRRRGYAAALVADVAARQLAAGRRFCFLFADVANPTSNRLYLRLGFRPVEDVHHYGLAPDDPGGHRR